MLHFDCDYMEGAHPLILERLVRTNMEQTPGYGLDPYCESARERIRQACGCTDAAVHFLVGGTQTNATVIDGILRPWEGVLAAQTGHINVHEAGAIEAGGHKVITLPQDDGKVRPDDGRPLHHGLLRRPHLPPHDSPRHALTSPTRPNTAPSTPSPSSKP